MESKIEQFPEKIGFTKIVKDKLREYSVLSIIAIIILVLVIYAYIRFNNSSVIFIKVKQRLEGRRIKVL